MSDEYLKYDDYKDAKFGNSVSQNNTLERYGIKNKGNVNGSIRIFGLMLKPPPIRKIKSDLVLGYPQFNEDYDFAGNGYECYNDSDGYSDDYSDSDSDNGININSNSNSDIDSDIDNEEDIEQFIRDEERYMSKNKQKFLNNMIKSKY